MKKPFFHLRFFAEGLSKMIPVFILLFLFLSPHIALGIEIPGSDVMKDLTAAGTLLKLVDSFVFVFGARILAGLCVLAAGWNLKEQRFSMAIICIFAAIIIATVPMWIGNFFKIGGGSIFAPPTQ